MIHQVDLESHIDNARRVKKLKAQRDRLLDALRDLVLQPTSEKAIAKAKRAIELSRESY